ncbi:MAG: hypothetical protein JWM10_2815, partial [Myxococcaceae bacterium]|nr:hypothetical protein [Myxococcaceae bacterium]
MRAAARRLRAGWALALAAACVHPGDLATLPP